ncbi:MAG TPA: Si-specific NAD(P)(+) transhydrogenase [Balneolaceae bacterium]|nr:Si-specific NAD(P)(+) transhydrogenase [Balneolaceae bacterium]
MSRDYDIIILGSGPAGFSCAMQSSKFDKKALIVEPNESNLGGTWINTGTIPSKAFREATKTILAFNNQFHDETDAKPYEHYRMKDLLQYKDDILEHENRKVKNDIKKNKVDIARGFGHLVNNHTVKVKSETGSVKTYTADYLLICTGSRPAPPDSFPIEDTEILNYESILNLTHIPRRLAIIGNGVHTMEYATIFAALGTRVYVLNKKEDHLPFLDNEIKQHFFDIISDSIRIHNDIDIDKIKFNAFRSYTEVHFKDKKDADRKQVVETEHVLSLGGRQPNTENLELENVQVKTDENGFIITDDCYQTSVENIYAAGDVIGFPRLVSASFSQGRHAACNMFGIPAQESAQQIPYGIYSIPEISRIGLTEREAKNNGYKVTVGRAFFKDIAKADMLNQQNGLLKLVFDTETFQLLGVHIVGDEASNLIHLGQSVLAFEGDVRYFIRHVMNYPTLSEAYRIAAFNGMNRVYQGGVQHREIWNDNA